MDKSGVDPYTSFVVNHVIDDKAGDGLPPHSLTQTCPALSPRNLRLTRGACRARGSRLGDQNQQITANTAADGFVR
jgi:hypothetical protein